MVFSGEGVTVEVIGVWALKFDTSEGPNFFPGEQLVCLEDNELLGELELVVCPAAGMPLCRLSSILNGQCFSELESKGCLGLGDKILSVLKVVIREREPLAGANDALGELAADFFFRGLNVRGEQRIGIRKRCRWDNVTLQATTQEAPTLGA